MAEQQRRCDLRHTLAPNRVAPLMVLELQLACADMHSLADDPLAANGPPGVGV